MIVKIDQRTICPQDENPRLLRDVHVSLFRSIKKISQSASSTVIKALASIGGLAFKALSSTLTKFKCNNKQ